MSVSRISSRFSRNVLTQCRLYYRQQKQQQQHHLPILSSQFHSVRDIKEKVSLLPDSALQWFGISSSASPQPNEKETSQSQGEGGSTTEKASASADSHIQDEKDESDIDAEDLSRDDLVKLVVEKEELLKMKDDEFRKLQDKFLRSYAEMENVMERTKREAENSKKFAIQNFVKALLDVPDNLGRASSVVKESFSKIDASKDTVGAMPLLKTLLEGVEMTDKQLAEVFKKFGVEKYDPTNEQFDPNKHNAVFQVPDPEKAPGVIAVCLKPGYTLHDRIIRPAEVGVTVAVETEADQSTNT
ncbi:protein GrpE-like [Nicotiana tabacum]|uniref:GrpE protein homolog n=2 Tax=Nicotiana TaxID=4085 RepID=Q9ZSP4_TOBAC|nr:protein GrpE-like [Nicotiana tabacum]XP_009778670.1 PREDICTED: grpE protein homolog, mitochondrial [Nicotiana sylvestris]AAC72386.1 chaperone GrpE type 1 [Nicotiana tabacum]